MSFSQAVVAHTCNLSYLGGRDQKDHSLRPTRANSSQDPILKIPTQKRAGRVVHVVRISLASVRL
jgi:hypothetical protein